MTEWRARRFWTSVTLDQTAEGWLVLLDGRTIKTPGRRTLRMPSAPMAEAVAKEWAAQDEVIDPTTMPVTRSVNSALDQTGPARAAVIDMLAAYAETDLTCHRADRPPALVARQAAAWDPVLAWSAKTLDAPFTPVAGIVAADQPAASLGRIHAAVADYGDFGLTGLHDLVVHSGSVLIGLAVAAGEINVSDGWRASQVDEIWQIEQWGEDDEASARTQSRAAAFSHAAQIVAWSGRA
ncbi:MAG: ATP12 family protein [Pseudomonadota bacterium]